MSARARRSCSPAWASATTSSRASRATTKTLVADPNPLAPARYAAHVQVAVPPMNDPGYVPRTARAVRGARRGRGRCRSPISTSRCSRALAPSTACRRSCPRPRSRARRSTSTRRTCSSAASGCRRRRPRCPRRRRRVPLPGGDQAAPRLGRTLDPPRARRSPRRASSSTTSKGRATRQEPTPEARGAATSRRPWASR